MADNVIFERTITRGDPNTDLFVKLVCDQANEVSRSVPRKMEIFEAMGLASPIIILTFTDATGDLFNHMKVNTSAVFTLNFGRTLEDSADMQLMIASYEQVNGVIGRPHDMEVKITLVNKNWYKFIAKRNNKGWANKKMSDIVSEIASELDFDEITVSESEGEIKSVIQPYWTNYDMLKWIKERIKPKEGDQYSHYEMGVTIDNNFHFESIHEILDRQKNDIVSGDIPILRLQSPPKNARESIREKQDNRGIPAYFLGVRNKEFFVSGIANGAGGYKSMHYDWDTAEFKQESHTFDLEPIPQLSDHSAIREEFNGNDIKFFTGRDPESSYQARNLLSEYAHSIQDFSIFTEGTPLIHIFNVVELVIPNTSLGSKVPINQMYSGFYLVAGVRHRFNLGANFSYITELTLSRHGVDNFDYEGFDNLISSSVGKIV